MTSQPDQPARAPGGSPAGTGTTMRQGDVSRQHVPPQTPAYDARYGRSRPRGAVIGFRVLAAVLMMVSGIWGFFEGLAAIIRGTFYVVTRNYAYGMSGAAWGWIHLILAVLIGFAGLAVLLGMLWARVTGVVLASLVTIANFLTIPYNPVWSIIVIALNLFIIWALLTPTREYA